MKRPYHVIASLVALNVVLIVIGLGRGDTGSGGAAVRVGLVFDVGGLGDKSFNDAAYRGLLRAEEELGVGIAYVEPGDGSDRESAIRQLASQGFDLVIGVGFIFTDDMRKLSGEFPAVHFACVDYAGSPDEKPIDNLVGLRFREHEGSYLVGAIAGLVTETRVVGFVGGMETPLIRKFEVGYRAGVEKVCPDCQVLAAYAGTEPKAFADPIAGKELALAQYGRGADIVYHASGKTGTGVFNAAREKGKLAIGTDSDQFHEAPCCVLTSMLKKVDVAVFEVSREVAEGTFVGGVREFGLAEGGVDYVNDDNNAHWLGGVVDRVEEVRVEILRGEVEVPFK